jgi:hypothetical protein
MFRDVLAHSGCIRSRRPYCGMSYECVWVSSELILCQDPINGYGAYCEFVGVTQKSTGLLETRSYHAGFER